MGWWPEGKEQNQAAICPECGLRARGPAAQSTRQCPLGRSSLDKAHGIVHLTCRGVIVMRHCPLLTSSGGETCSLYVFMLPEGSGRPASFLHLPGQQQGPGAGALCPCCPAWERAPGPLGLFSAAPQGHMAARVLLCQASR